ncbi:putative acid--amino-acid ligase (peptide synthase) [Helianthus anomalus]
MSQDFRDGETVAVIYFRAGYAPTDYPSESDWKARLLIKESSAIKCPFNIISFRGYQNRTCLRGKAKRYLFFKQV